MCLTSVRLSTRLLADVPIHLWPHLRIRTLTASVFPASEQPDILLVCRILKAISGVNDRWEVIADGLIRKSVVVRQEHGHVMLRKHLLRHVDAGHLNCPAFLSVHV